MIICLFLLSNDSTGLTGSSLPVFVLRFPALGPGRSQVQPFSEGVEGQPSVIQSWQRSLLNPKPLHPASGQGRAGFSVAGNGNWLWGRGFGSGIPDEVPGFMPSILHIFGLGVLVWGCKKWALDVGLSVCDAVLLRTSHGATS